MFKASQKIIAICGPTSSGKSDVAIRLSKKFNGEVISADSRQIYRGMNIGTGKVPGLLTVIPSEATTPQGVGAKLRDPERLQKTIYICDNIPHHLIDIVNPMDEFNVSHFKNAANEAIKDILNRGKLPIICGGTGFWISALINNIEIPNVEPDEKLRSMLRSKTTEELFVMLSEMDPDRAATIEKQNPVRLIRAIEICKAIGKVPKLKDSYHPKLACLAGRRVSGSQKMLKQVQHDSTYDFLQIAIDVPRETLNEKIKKRLDDRFESGIVEEVENLHKSGTSWEWMEKIGLEYRWISLYLQNKISLKEMKEKLYFDIIHYAKRQATWLKKSKETIWLSDYEDIENTVAEFIGN